MRRGGGGGCGDGIVGDCSDGEGGGGPEGREDSSDVDTEMLEKYLAKDSTLSWSVRRMLLLESRMEKGGGSRERPVFRSLALCRVLTRDHILDEDNLALIPNTYLVHEAFLASPMVFLS